MEIMVEISIDNEKFTFEEEEIEEFIKDIIENEYESDKAVYISLMITTNDEIQNINREYRGKNVPTDVISFAYNETENEGHFDVLGDIIISYDRVEEQAKEYDHSIKREFFYVLVHGILHLLGYDHIEEEDKSIMREKEEEILGKYSISRD